MSTVSVIIPAYNQGHYLGEAIQSVLDQTYPDFEIVVIDDESTDNSREVVQGFSDPRVHYIFQENRGLSAARNTGILSATGSLVTFLDSDDRFLPNKLELLGKLLAERPEVGMVAGQAILIDQHGRTLERKTHARLSSDLSMLLLGNPLHVGSILLRRTWLDKVGFFDESLRACEDWDLWLRLALAGCQMVSIDQPVSFYRVHVGQMTREPDRMRNAARAVLDKIYCRPDLPHEWLEMRDQVYSRYYLVSAAHFYRVGDYAQAMIEMKEAVYLYPEWLANDAEELAKKITVWANDVRVADPLKFLEDVYDHLPEELAVLRRRRGEIGRMAMQVAFQAYSQGNLATARRAVLRAFRYQPAWMRNRGALSIFIRSFVPRRS